MSSKIFYNGREFPRDLKARGASEIAPVMDKLIFRFPLTICGARDLRIGWAITS